MLLPGSEACPLIDVDGERVGRDADLAAEAEYNAILADISKYGVRRGWWFGARAYIYLLSSYNNRHVT